MGEQLYMFGADIELKPHNICTYEEAKEQIKMYGRTAVVQPTGTGKSYILRKLLDDYTDGLKFIIGSSKDALDELEIGPLYGCTDVVTCTYQSLGKMVIRLETAIKKVSVIVIDELHRAGAPMWGEALDRLIELFPDAVVIGLTATPIRYLDKKKDMVEKLFKGVHAGKLTLLSAMEQGILPTPTHVVEMLDIQGDLENRLLKIQKLNEENKAVNSQEIVKALQVIEDYRASWGRDERIINTLSRHIGSFRDRNYKHIVFAPNIKIADELAPIVEKWFREVYKDTPVEVYKVHSRNTSNRRDMEEFRRLKNTSLIEVLIVVNMANESLHIKGIKSVILLRYTNSPNLYLQQIGRALASGGYDTVIFDFVGKLEATNDILAILNDVESKVNSSVKSKGNKIIRERAQRLFKAYEDNTEEFRGVLDSVDRLLSDGWEKNMASMLEQMGTEEVLPSDLAKWFKKAQQSFIAKSLPVEKDRQFREFGVKAYTLDSMSETEKYLLALIDQYANGRDIGDMNLHMLKYYEYCGKFNISTVRYIEDMSVELGLTDEWVRGELKSLKELTGYGIAELVSKILNNKSIRILGDEFNPTEYLKLIKEIIEVTEIMRSKRDKDNISNVDVLWNIASQFWREHTSDIGSKVEIDTGTLVCHRAILREVGYEALSEEDEAIVERLKYTQSNLRAGSVKLLLGQVGLEY